MGNCFVCDFPHTTRHNQAQYTFLHMHIDCVLSWLGEDDDDAGW